MSYAAKAAATAPAAVMHYHGQRDKRPRGDGNPDHDARIGPVRRREAGPRPGAFSFASSATTRLPASSLPRGGWR
jgi:hypothetical protein